MLFKGFLNELDSVYLLVSFNQFGNFKLKQMCVDGNKLCVSPVDKTVIKLIFQFFRAVWRIYNLEKL